MIDSDEGSQRTVGDAKMAATDGSANNVHR